MSLISEMNHAGTVLNGNKTSGIVASAMLFLFNFFFATRLVDRLILP